MNAVPIVILIVAVAFIVRRGSRRRSTPNLGAAVSSGIGLVATREIQQRLRGRILRVATLVMLLVIAAAIVIPTLGGKGGSQTKVGITGTVTTAERAAILDIGKQVGSTVHIVAEANPATARADVSDGAVDLAVVDGDQVVVPRALTDSDASTTALTARALAVALGEQRAEAAAKLTPAQQAALGKVAPVAITGLKPAKGSDSDQGTAVVGLILMFVMLSQYGTWTLMGVMEEKASRVVEVLLAALRPNQLLGGKVLGIGVLVFAQATILVGFALGLGAAVGSNILNGTAPVVVVSVLGWLVLGYAFYSWVFAAAGSMVERQDQVQAIAFPVTIPLLIGYVSSITAVSSGHASLYITVLAYLPPTAPFAMPVLVSLHAATWWQFTLSALISLGSTVMLARFASAVYRRAVLRTGGRVKLRDVLSGARTQAGPPRTNEAV
ncbi:MAG TPA: ABC transporter permease [Mycobacteriales bacterium]|nr:ABC transporter permease [Mycobacteriales bacterium]